MAVSYHSHTTSFAKGTTVSYSYDVGTGTDRYLITMDYLTSSANVTAVTFNSVSLTQKQSGRTAVYDLANPASGSRTLRYTASAYRTHLSFPSSWTGVDQTTPSGSVTTNSGSSTTPSTGSITCPSNGVVWGGFSCFYSSAGASISGAGNTSLGNRRDGASGAVASAGYRTSTGSVSWSKSGSSTWDARAVPINAASAGGAAETNQTMQTLEDQFAVEPTARLGGLIQ